MWAGVAGWAGVFYDSVQRTQSCGCVLGCRREAFVVLSIPVVWCRAGDSPGAGVGIYHVCPCKLPRVCAVSRKENELEAMMRS